MRKSIYIIIGLMVFALAGCGKKDQMVDFIPTPTPSAENTGEDLADDSTAGSGEDASADTTQDSASGTEEGTSDEPIVEGNTTTKYVKLSEYGAVLNVRSEPSKDGQIVGSLVHAEKIEVTKIENGWACFVLKDKYAYVNADFLVDERPEYLNPPTPTPKPTLPPTNTPAPETDSSTSSAPEI